MAGKEKNQGSKSESEAPTTDTRTGAGPEVGAGMGGTGEPPNMAKYRHGGNAFKAEEAAGSAYDPDQEDTGPVVEGTGGGLQFEHKPSGTRAQPRKEQPTTPERAEIVEARRLEKEMHKSRVKANKDTPGAPKEGDLVRYYISAASGWGVAKLTGLDETGRGGSAVTEAGMSVPLIDGQWEPAPGRLAMPELTEKDLKEQGGTIDREAADREAGIAEKLGPRPTQLPADATQEEKDAEQKELERLAEEDASAKAAEKKKKG